MMDDYEPTEAEVQAGRAARARIGVGRIDVDELDAFIVENMKDPTFAAAYTRAQLVAIIARAITSASWDGSTVRDPMTAASGLLDTVLSDPRVLAKLARRLGGFHRPGNLNVTADGDWFTFNQLLDGPDFEVDPR